MYFCKVVKFPNFGHLASLLRPLGHLLRLSARSSAKENINSWCEALSSIFLFQGALRAKSKVSQVCVTSVISWAQGFLVMKWCSGSGRHHFRMSFKLQDYSVKSWSWQQNHQKYFKSVVLTGSQLVTFSQNSAFSYALGHNFQTFRRAAAQKKMLQNMVRSILLFFPHVWWPSGQESEVLRVHMYLHVSLKFWGIFATESHRNVNYPF